MNDAALERRLGARKARIAVVGMGYAGLPMAVEFAREFGWENQPEKVKFSP